MFIALISKPLLLLPTIWATIESVLFSELNFEESHSGRGIPNAFRHAAWNLLIAKNCSIFTSNRKAIVWAKYITDLHEECFPNEDFDREMDLHNNEVGREFYKEMMNRKITNKKEMISALMEKTQTAIGLTEIHEIQKAKGELVFFKE